MNNGPIRDFDEFPDPLASRQRLPVLNPGRQNAPETPSTPRLDRRVPQTPNSQLHPQQLASTVPPPVEMISSGQADTGDQVACVALDDSTPATVIYPDESVDHEVLETAFATVQTSEDDAESHLIRRSVPVWMTSMAFHLVVLLLLAMLTLGGTESASVLTVTLGENPTPLDLAPIEIGLAATSDPLESALQPLDLADAQPLSEEADVVLLADQFSVDSSGLSELGNFEVGNPLGDPINSIAMKKSGTKFFGIESAGESFVFVIDCSQSMEQELRWHRAREELKYAIQSLDADQRFLVLLYNSRTYMMMDLPLSQLGLIPATQENKDRLVEWLWRQYPNGGTYPMQAMEIGLGFAPDSIFLLSDGEIRDKTPKMLARTNGRRGRNDGSSVKIPIHTIALGSRAGLGTMQSIARQNNGYFRQVR